MIKTRESYRHKPNGSHKTDSVPSVPAIKLAAPYLLVAPAVVYLLATLVYPLAYSFLLMFKDFAFVPGLNPLQMSWAGFSNFVAILTSSEFQTSLLTTAKLLIVVPIELALGFGLALSIAAVGPSGMRRIYVAAGIAPFMVPAIAAGLIWSMILNPNSGIVNSMLVHFGVPRVDFLGNPATALISLGVVDIWQWTPFVTVLLYAALQGVPTDLVEAARVDGAHAFQLVRYVKVPIIVWPILVVVLIRGADVIREVAYVYALTQGGPGISTQTLGYFVYHTSFTDFELSQGSVASWITFGIVYVGSLLLLRTGIATYGWNE
jgi:multiple sugar transport system permease protein